MDSVDIVHGPSGQSGHCPWKLWTKSSETVQTGQCPWIQWTLSMDSVDSLDIVHGHPGLSPGVQADWTMSMDNVH